MQKEESCTLTVIGERRTGNREERRGLGYLGHTGLTHSEGELRWNDAQLNVELGCQAILRTSQVGSLGEKYFRRGMLTAEGRV